MTTFEELVIYTLCFFPFIRFPFLKIGTDVQPFAVIFASFALVIDCVKTNKIKITKHIKLFTFIFVWASIILLYSLLSDASFFSIIRSYMSYISIVVISLVVNKMLTYRRGINENLIKKIINVWLLVGIIQKKFWPSFATWIVSNARTTEGRGVISLASEPSFYGYMCFFMLLFVMKFKEKRTVYIINLLFQITILAQSSVTIVYLAVLIMVAALYYFFNGNVKINLSILSIGACILLILFYYVQYHHNSRMTYLLYSFFNIRSLDDLGNLVEKDESIQTRMYYIIYCLSEFAKYKGLPHGYISTERIESGYGAMLYELGFIGLFFIIGIWIIIYKGNKKTMSFIVATSFTIILFSAIQMSLPLIGFYIGYMSYESYNKKIILNKQYRGNIVKSKT